MKLRNGGVESIFVAVILVALVIAFIATSVKKVSNSGEETIRKGVNQLSSGQVTMRDDYWYLGLVKGFEYIWKIKEIY